MSRPKALLDADGASFVTRLANTLREGGCDEVWVVVRSASGAVAEEVARGPGRPLVNPGGAGGQIGSLRVALDHIRQLPDRQRPGAVAFSPVDNPAVASETVRSLVDEWRRSDALIVLPRHGSKRGHPVIADMAVTPEFFESGLRQGAREVIRRDPARVLEVPVPDPAAVDDLDTPAQYRNRFPSSAGDRAGPRGQPQANLSPAQVAAAVLKATEADKRIFTAVVTQSSVPELTGRRWWLSGDERGGWPGDAALEEAVSENVRSLFPASASSGAKSRDFACRSPDGRSATATVYIELYAPPAKMVIVGAGHVAIPLARLSRMLGLRVEVLDDRPEFAARDRFPGAAAVRVIDFRNPFADTALQPADHVVLVTRGHRFDYECLVQLLRMPDPPAYIGMIGSRRRVRATHEQLAREGFSAEAMKRVRAPVGLDLGGQTPAEIAVSVAAEIVMVHGGGTGAPLFEKERIVDRFFRRPKA